MNLNISLTDADLNHVPAQLPPNDVSDLSAAVQPDGVHVSGKYGVVHFTSVWTLAIAGEKLLATLSDLRGPFGVPMEPLRAWVLGKIAAGHERLSVAGDGVSVDLNQPYIKLYLGAVRCEVGQLTIQG